jgi:hypothetical protein
MGEFRDGLDAEAGQVGTKPDALDLVKARAHRRRRRSQVGSGVAALAIAGAGFAFGAFRGPEGRPLAGPSSTTPTDVDSRGITIEIKVADQLVRRAPTSLARALGDDGYRVEWFQYVSDVDPPPRTTIRYGAGAEAEANEIRRQLLPGVPLAPAPGSGAEVIVISLGVDIDDVRNRSVQVRVLDVSGRPGAARAAADMLAADGYDIVKVGEADPIYDTTIVACAPQHDDDGFRILNRYFPDADFRGEIPSEEHDVTVYIGPDLELPGVGAGN